MTLPSKFKRFIRAGSSAALLIGTNYLTAVTIVLLMDFNTDSTAPAVIQTSPLPRQKTAVEARLYGNHSLFHYSPDKKRIAFVENVFDEFHNDYDRHYAVTIFDVESRQEWRIFVGTYKTSGLEWLDDETIRVYLNAGTGVRAYRDVPAQVLEPIVFKDYVDRGEDFGFWTPDDEYTQKAMNTWQAEAMYRRLSDG